MINATLITIVAVFCFASIRNLKSKNRLSERAFKTLVLIGPLSWAAQMGLLAMMTDSNHVIISLAAMLATMCFWLLMMAVRDGRISGGAAGQMILWGQLVFPLVLVSLLPNGAWTIFSLVP